MACGCGKKTNHAVASADDLVAAAQARADAAREERTGVSADAVMALELENAALRSQVHAMENGRSAA